MTSQTQTACCDAAGVVRFVDGPKPLKGTLVIATGNRQTMGAIRACCRLSYDNKTYLVPGIPEAKTQEEGIEALMKFCDWLKSRRII